MQYSFQIPEDLAERLRPRERELAQILSLGLRELDAKEASGFSGLADVMDFLAGLPSPEQILALRPSRALQERIDDLLARGRESALTDQELDEWQKYQYVEHLVRKAKIRATQQLQGR